MTRYIAVDSPEYLDRLAVVSMRAEALHDPLDEYHGYEIHPLTETLPATRELAAVCGRYGIEVNYVVTDCGSLLHDTDTTKPLTNRRYVTKEERSGHRAVPIVVEAGFLVRDAMATMDAIVTTAAGVPFNSVEGALLGLGDMINLSDYDLMRRRCLDAWQETQRVNNAIIPLRDWLKNCPPMLRSFALKALPPELRDVYELHALQGIMADHIDRIERETPESLLEAVRPGLLQSFSN